LFVSSPSSVKRVAFQLPLANQQIATIATRLIPLTQVRLYVVSAWYRIVLSFSSDCLV
jgi:hypothetical protein